jgi:hypothetical protein
VRYNYASQSKRLPTLWRQMKHTILSWLLTIVTVVVIVACNSGSSQHEQAADGLFLDYQATGDEALGEITVRLQFKLAGPDGKAVTLDTPATVSFDGRPLEEGKSKMNGAYYEAVFPVDAQDQLHVIDYRSPSGESYKDSFYFPFFRLAPGLPETISRANELEVNLSGLDSITIMHALLTDTSFYGRGIDRLDSVAGGKMSFSPSDLSNLRNGPVHLEFFRESERMLERNGFVHGRLYLSYNVSREVQLKD